MKEMGMTSKKTSRSAGLVGLPRKQPCKENISIIQGVVVILIAEKRRCRHAWFRRWSFRACLELARASGV